MEGSLKIPYTQQLSSESTPLKKLLPILRQNAGDSAKLRKAIGSAFFRDTKSAHKMAGNTIIALRYHGIVSDGDQLTQFGKELVDAPDATKAVELLAKNILLKLDGIMLVETLREMKLAGSSFKLVTITDELRIRGFEVSDNSSDLSGVLGWLREAGVLSDYEVNETRYSELVGSTPKTIEALKDLSEAQILFLRALLALGVKDWTAHNAVVQHAEALYSGQVTYNWKALDKQVIQPLVKGGFIEQRKAPKSTLGARGGKAAEVRPTEKFEKEIAEPILTPIYKSAGFRDIAKIRSIPLAQLVADIKQKKDTDLRGSALEKLAIRICQLLDLDFFGWRETDEDLVAGGEVDAFMHAARLVYSRWQIQCKASDKITYETLAKEVGVVEVSLSNVILIVGTGTITEGAALFRKKIIATKPLNIIIIDGKQLDAIVENPTAITGIMCAQALDAMQIKPKPSSMLRTTKEDEDDGGGGGSISKKSSPKASESPDSADGPNLFGATFSTSLGSMYHGDAYDVLRYLIHAGIRVKLLFTSPPFALTKKKAYGNEDQEQYVAWFMRFAPLFHQILEPGGSFVMDIGGSWIPGIPARSVYQYELLLRLCKSGFYLAQEFYHYNPARLPTPAEWVTVRRLRVKDAMNNVWWFVKDPFVDADNRRVLREYSDSMKNLIKNGYEAKLRPSGHNISTKFGVDRGGSIPPNLLQFSNTESNSFYLRECTRNGIKPHPARFPIALPDFFIRFITKPGELVLDPFAGSNVTGESAELLGRRWLACEIEEGYITGARYRFMRKKSSLSSTG